jgi:hypothetical protein
MNTEEIETVNWKKTGIWFAIASISFFLWTSIKETDSGTYYIALLPENILVGPLAALMIPLPNVVISLIFLRYRNWGSFTTIYRRWSIGLFVVVIFTVLTSSL